MKTRTYNGKTVIDTPLMVNKKKKSRERLTERYLGKRDLLATWDDCFPGKDLKYRNDLKRRVHAHKQDLIYRGENL